MYPVKIISHPESSQMFVSLSIKYCLAVFIAGIGIYQLAAGRSNLKGVLFFQSKLWTYILGCITIIPSLYYFFSWNYRNATGIIEGSQQAGLFVGSMAAALLITLFVSSWLNHSRLPVAKACDTGIEALRTATFLQALRRRYGANFED